MGRDLTLWEALCSSGVQLAENKNGVASGNAWRRTTFHRMSYIIVLIEDLAEAGCDRGVLFADVHSARRGGRW